MMIIRAKDVFSQEQEKSKRKYALENIPGVINQSG